ncbi:MAG: ribosome biogenesis GTP-binding protein YihA/YsxC, partial [Bacteroidota bacterium]
FVGSGVRLDQLPKADRCEIALIGRSNVGKSSLINRLVDHQGLAKSSAQPGKTRLINHFSVEMQGAPPMYLVDLPGYGYAKASKKDIEAWNIMMRNYLRKRPNLVCVMQLLDSRLPPQKVDLEFTNQLGEWSVPFVMVYTKTDKGSMVKARQNADAYGKAMLGTWEDVPPVYWSSAEDGRGRMELLTFLWDCSSSYQDLSPNP